MANKDDKIKSQGGKRALVIFNPNAGLRVKRDIKKLVEDKLRSLNYEVDLFYLNKDFEKDIEDYNFNLVGLVVAVGGDGTVKVAGRTIIENNLDIPLALVPFGSANVIAMILGISMNPKKSTKLLGNKINTAIDVGLINKKYYFLVGFSIGYVSRVVLSTTESIKNRLGFLGYLLSLLFAKIRIRKFKFEITTQDKIFWIKGNSLVVCNALSYFGLKPKKDINPWDGILNLYILTNKTFFDMIRAFFYIIWYQKPPKFVFTLDNEYFKIRLSRKTKACQVDGDFINLGKDIEVDILKEALRIIVPKVRQ